MRIVGVLLLLLAAGALVARYVPATNRALLVMAALSPYLMLGAPVGALVFALSRHWTLVSVAAVLTVAVLAVQLPWYIGSPDPDTGTTLRFVSANLLLGEAEPAAVAGLAAEHADILAVQELTPELAAALSPALARDFPYSALRPRERAAGVGLWSRYPIITSGSDETHRTSVGIPRSVCCRRTSSVGTPTPPSSSNWPRVVLMSSRCPS